LGVYLYYPIAVMMGIKLTFFAITSVKLYMYRNSTKMATKDDQHQQLYAFIFAWNLANRARNILQKSFYGSLQLPTILQIVLCHGGSLHI
jgi:hypothetical protein